MIAAPAGELHWTYGLWPSVWKLLRLRALIFLSGLRRSSWKRKLGVAILGMAVIGFLVFAYFLSSLFLKFLRSPQIAGLSGGTGSILDSIPVLVVGGAFLGILLTSFGVLLQALYLAGDMDFLLAAPVPARAVFVAKLLQAILPNFSLICLFILPVLFGLGSSQGYNPVYYPLVLVELAALALAASGAASLLVMAVVRIFPARRVAEVIGFIGALMGFLCSQTGQIANMQSMTAEQAGEAMSWVSRLDTGWSPLSWAGRGLVLAGEGQWGSAAIYLTLSLGLSLAVFGVALVSAERMYYSGWSSMQVARRRGREQRKKLAPQSPAGLKTDAWRGAAIDRWLAPAIRAVMVKDYHELRRDLRNLSQLITPLVFGVIYSVMFLRSGGEPPLGRGEAPEWWNLVVKNAMLYGNVGIALLVGWMMVGRLAGIGFSQEGKSYWLLKTAPVSPAMLLAAKFLVAYLPALLLGWVFLLAITLVQRAAATQLFFTLPVVALSTAGNTGLNLSFGVVGARLNWEDPRQMLQGGIGCLSSISSMIYLPLSMVVFFAPALVAAPLGWSSGVGQVVGLALGGTLALVCAFLPVWLVRRRVSRLGEG